MKKTLEFLAILTVALGVGFLVRNIWSKRAAEPVAPVTQNSKPWLRDPITRDSGMSTDCKDPDAPWKCDPIAGPKKPN